MRRARECRQRQGGQQVHQALSSKVQRDGQDQSLHALSVPVRECTGQFSRCRVRIGKRVHASCSGHRINLMAVDRRTRYHLQPSQLAVRRVYKPHQPVTCHQLQWRVQRKTRQALHWWTRNDRADLIVYLRVTQLSESAILIIVHDILGIDTAYSMKIGCSHGLHCQSEMGRIALRLVTAPCSPVWYDPAAVQGFAAAAAKVNARQVRIRTHRLSTTALPPFMTHLTFRTAVISLRGSPSIATRSAKAPGATIPSSFALPSNSAPTMVAESRACAGVMPAFTNQLRSPVFSPKPVKTASEPIAILTWDLMAR